MLSSRRELFAVVRNAALQFKINCKSLRWMKVSRWMILQWSVERLPVYFNDFTCQSWCKMAMNIERDIAKRIRKIHQRLKDRCYKTFSSMQACSFFQSPSDWNIVSLGKTKNIPHCLQTGRYNPWSERCSCLPFSF